MFQKVILTGWCYMLTHLLVLDANIWVQGIVLGILYDSCYLHVTYEDLESEREVTCWSLFSRLHREFKPKVALLQNRLTGEAV